jgi:lysophospholipase L1-like esterase
MSDSHGRTISERLNITDPNNLRAIGIVKPNANIVNVLQNHKSFTEDMTKNDYLVVLGGTNDLDYDGCESIITENIEALLEKTDNTNVIVSPIPFRYDIPFVNTRIKRINLKLKKLTERYSHSTFLSFNNMNRNDYSYYGLHLNSKGKSKLTHLISDFINHKGKIPVIITNRHIKNDKSQTYNETMRQNNNFLGFSPKLRTYY